MEENLKLNKKRSFGEVMRGRKARILPTILVSIIIPFILCISVPFEIYCNNSSEFVFGILDFLPFCLVFCVGIASALIILLLLLPNTAYKICLYLFFGLGFMFFLQGTYLNGNLSLAGDNMSSGGVSKVSIYINLGVWVLLIAGFIALALSIKDKKGYIRLGTIVLSVIVLATQVMSITFSCINNKDAFVSPEMRNSSDNAVNNEVPLTTKNLTNISTSKNIFYFVIDRFDETYAESAYISDSSIYDKLEGFTWFKDNISIYGHTFPAVCNMLTGAEHKGNLYREPYLEDAYNNDNPLKELSENGYDINLYTTMYYSYTGKNMPSYISNLEAGEYSVDNSFGLSFRMVELSLFRCVPLIAKWAFKDINSSTCNSYATFTSDGEINYQSSNSSAYNLVDIKGFQKTDKKQFTFIHVDGTHKPESDLSSKKYTIPSVENALKNSFRIINKYIDELKQSGMYKDATVIITGDHGYSKNDLTKLTTAVQTALFVKPAGVESGVLKQSTAQTSHADIWATIHSSIGLESRFNVGKNVFDISETELRTRYYIWQTYQSGSMDEFIYKITGNGSEFNNWHEEVVTHYNKDVMQ